MHLPVPQSKQASKQLSSDDTIWKVREKNLSPTIEFGNMVRKVSFAKGRKDICYPKRRHQQGKTTHTTGPAIATCFSVWNVEFLRALTEEGGCEH